MGTVTLGPVVFSQPADPPKDRLASGMSTQLIGFETGWQHQSGSEDPHGADQILTIKLKYGGNICHHFAGLEWHTRLQSLILLSIIIACLLSEEAHR
jgi:hypothetical protein